MLHETIRKTFSTTYTRIVTKGSEVFNESIKSDLSILGLVTNTCGTASFYTTTSYNPNVDRISSPECCVLALVIRTRKNGCSYNANTYKKCTMVVYRTSFARSFLTLSI